MAKTCFQIPFVVLEAYSLSQGMWKEFMNILPTDKGGPRYEVLGMPKTVEIKSLEIPEDLKEDIDDCVEVYLFWTGGNAVRIRMGGRFDPHYGTSWDIKGATFWWHPQGQRHAPDRSKKRQDFTAAQVEALKWSAYHRLRVDVDYNGDPSHLREWEAKAVELIKSESIG